MIAYAVLFYCFRETHVWFVLPDEFKSVSLLNQYMELLSPCEKENVLTMRGDQLQKRALLARALVRTTIARCKFFVSYSCFSSTFTYLINTLFFTATNF